VRYVARVLRVERVVNVDTRTRKGEGTVSLSALNDRRGGALVTDNRN